MASVDASSRPRWPGAQTQTAAVPLEWTENTTGADTAPQERAIGVCERKEYSTSSVRLVEPKSEPSRRPEQLEWGATEEVKRCTCALHPATCTEEGATAYQRLLRSVSDQRGKTISSQTEIGLVQVLGSGTRPHAPLTSLRRCVGELRRLRRRRAPGLRHRVTPGRRVDLQKYLGRLCAVALRGVEGRGHL